ncbi:type I-E CRISPR-associated protein Cse2/CasB [Vreelandella venusta]|uniref:Type I-E CRISPR-associated protein Cse2/CasB n=1 Tax=Halomonas hydrothermalis TaxID=115561 RepID=A0A6F8TY61_9GAMM|nr:type I-E CRISPR-associated protein Cse2/CasB [Halomonas hydrothermalis]BCB06327.1 type I-E CRISPR-associated protein Cse2/CasB [Halomonas hydrothermalis]
MQEAQATPPPNKPKSSDEKFVDTVIAHCLKDKGLAARLRRADNPAMEYQSWELLGSLSYLGIDLEVDYKRIPYVTVASAIAKAKAERNGTLSLGRAIAACYEDGRDSAQAKTRLRRLLASSELAEVCRLLRPVLTLIDSKVGQPVDYIRLLRQLRFFGHRTKTQWAQEFYGQSVPVDKQEAAT